MFRITSTFETAAEGNIDYYIWITFFPRRAYILLEFSIEPYYYFIAPLGLGLQHVVVNFYLKPNHTTLREEDTLWNSLVLIY